MLDRNINSDTHLRLQLWNHCYHRPSFFQGQKNNRTVQCTVAVQLASKLTILEITATQFIPSPETRCQVQAVQHDRERLLVKGIQPKKHLSIQTTDALHITGGLEWLHQRTTMNLVERRVLRGYLFPVLWGTTCCSSSKGYHHFNSTSDHIKNQIHSFTLSYTQLNYKKFCLLMQKDLFSLATMDGGEIELTV